MALGPRLDLRQSQSLVMTPQLQQAIRLLALSNLEVEAFLAAEIERNPLLETEAGEAPNAGEGQDERDPAEDSGASAGVDVQLGGGDAGADLDISPAEADSRFADDGTDPIHTADPVGGAGGEAPDLDGFAAEPATLRDHLDAQAGQTLTGERLFLARQIIAAIDEAGYFTGDLADMALRLGVARADMASALAMVQQFDPTGVGARTLAECLQLQLVERDRFDPCMEALLANLDLLAAGALSQLRRICRVDEEDLRDMIAEIRALDPKPGCRIGGGGAPPVIPDLFVTAAGDGWRVEINPATVPRLLVNRAYHATLSADCARGGKAAQSWLRDSLAEASWLVKALDQRQRTILAVASEIVTQQQGFFTRGVAGLRPLTLARVAEAISMHESTVSRVTSNKYLACPRGTFELKYFFSSGIQSAAGGEAVSAEAVKARIKALIDRESADAILSDDRLVELLNGEGFDIARRTVAKYREALGIGSSVQRRRAKALAG